MIKQTSPGDKCLLTCPEEFGITFPVHCQSCEQLRVKYNKNTDNFFTKWYNYKKQKIGKAFWFSLYSEQLFFVSFQGKTLANWYVQYCMYQVHLTALQWLHCLSVFGLRPRWVGAGRVRRYCQKSQGRDLRRFFRHWKFKYYVEHI